MNAETFLKIFGPHLSVYLKNLFRDRKLKKSVERAVHVVFPTLTAEILILCQHKEFTEQLFNLSRGKSINAKALVDLGVEVAKKNGIDYSRSELIEELKKFALDLINIFNQVSPELGKRPGAFNDFYRDISNLSILEIEPPESEPEKAFFIKEKQDKIPSNEIEAEPPKLLKNIKWLYLHGKDHKGLVFTALIVLIIIGVLSNLDIFSVTKESPKPRPEPDIVEVQKKSSMNIIPDVSQAEKEVLIVSLSQLKNKPELADVSRSVPGYFEFTSSPSSGSYSYSCIDTKSSVKPNYYASVRIVGLMGANVLELKGRGIWFAISAIRDRYFIYESEENWTTWRKLNVRREPDINTLAIYQKGREISAFLNNNYVATFTKLKKAEPGPIGICFKANPKTGGRIHFQKFSVWELRN